MDTNNGPSRVDGSLQALFLLEKNKSWHLVVRHFMIFLEKNLQEAQQRVFYAVQSLTVYQIGTWSIRGMSLGKLESVK